jgi:bis(5'-adenosyl)-triphosphatase
MHGRVVKMSYNFGPHVLHPSQVFFESAYSIAVVNLKPITPGHVLIVSKRVESRLMGLLTEEYKDLFETVRIVAPKLEAYYGAEAVNIAVQDGSAAGQSVPHVHVHILPRKKGSDLFKFL